jgi:hypothetical protein
MLAGSSKAAAEANCGSGNSSQQCSPCKNNGRAADAGSSSNADEQLVLKLLQELPQLQVLHLKQCSHLQQGGWVLARQCCGKDGCAAVVVLRH